MDHLDVLERRPWAVEVVRDGSLRHCLVRDVCNMATGTLGLRGDFVGASLGPTQADKGAATATSRWPEEGA